MAIDDAEAEGNASVGGASDGSGASDAASGGNQVAVGEYTWEDYRRDYHDGGSFDAGARAGALGFETDDVPEYLATGAACAERLAETVDRHTVDVAEGLGARVAVVRDVADLDVVEEFLADDPERPLVLDIRTIPEVSRPGFPPY